ncbi:MAG: hypothetical protein PHR15_07870 [Atopobiaceae bacterium]|jgi:hypothetical protein|nr:hypothetical protein [Atopobiaceae bacterium]MCH4214045.1 hypothetical protein [Atopobiaceae bacterium]MCH4229508.1 hypothetical protein [Atopobiaceae bacterium]MCH4276397.1 hypothetical protein [Atopobiaceae bacterium]MCI1226484.1 hypothetical protein [Atopobiaceae bacterium]
MPGTWNFVRNRSLADILGGMVADGRDLPAWIADTLDARTLTRSQVIRDSHLNPTFAYQIMAGARHASRDKLIQLAFGLRLDPDDADAMLERGGMSALRAYDRRDVVVAYCLARSTGLAACDDLLWSLGEDTIVGS